MPRLPPGKLWPQNSLFDLAASNKVSQKTVLHDAGRVYLGKILHVTGGIVFNFCCRTTGHFHFLKILKALNLVVIQIKALIVRNRAFGSRAVHHMNAKAVAGCND